MLKLLSLTKVFLAKNLKVTLKTTKIKQQKVLKVKNKKTFYTNFQKKYLNILIDCYC